MPNPAHNEEERAQGQQLLQQDVVYGGEGDAEGKQDCQGGAVTDAPVDHASADRGEEKGKGSGHASDDGKEGRSPLAGREQHRKHESATGPEGPLQKEPPEAPFHEVAKARRFSLGS